MASEAATPEITVVLATYNRPDVLACAIESVRRQTFTDWELVVVGDNCTTATASVVASFDDARIRYVNLTRNFGEQAGPNNYGVSQTSSPLLAFLNHDDVWLPHHLATLREVLHGQHADLVFGACASIGGQTPLPLRYEELHIGLQGAGNGGTWSPVRVEGTVPASGWLLRRRVHDELRGWRLGRETWSDPSQDFLFRAWRNGFRIRAAQDVTVVVCASMRREDSYLHPGGEEQRWVLEHLGDPGFATELVALAYSSNERFTARQQRRGDALRRAGGLALAAVGCSPRALYFRLRHGFGRGDYIRHLRRRRGLPTLVTPVADDALLRFEMVRRGCRVDLPARVRFVAGAGGARFLAAGWSRPEEHGVWSDGPTAELLFDLGIPPGRTVNVGVEIHPWLAPGSTSVPVSVSVETGGPVITTWAVTTDEVVHGVPVGSAATKSGLLHLTLRFPPPVSPSAAGVADDPREMSVRLVEAWLELAEPVSDSRAADPAT